MLVELEAIRQRDEQCSVACERHPGAEELVVYGLGLLAEDHLQVREGVVMELGARHSDRAASLSGFAIGDVDDLL